MNIYYLENNEITSWSGCGYYEFVIIAHDEKSARKIAFEESVGRGDLNNPCDEEKRWIDGRASCIKIGTSIEDMTEEKIIMEKYNQGD